MTKRQKIKKILKSKNIEPDYRVLCYTNLDAHENLSDCLKDFGIKFDFSKLTKEELEEVAIAYAGCVIDYHPENYHQERGTILKTQNIFLKYGFSDDDINRMDFI